MHNTEISIDLLSGGQSTSIVLSAVSAQGPVVALPTNHPPGVPVKCTLTPDVNCWMRKGSNPTAVVDVDQKLLAGNTYRVELLVGERIAAIAGGAGTLSFTPGA